MLFFTADQHFNHRNIIRHCNRPFVSVDEMNEELVALHNRVVGVDDQVLHLGDLSWDRPDWIHSLRGKHYLVPGNHDACHPMHKKHRREVRRCQDAGITVLDPQVVQHLLPQAVLLCHFPFTGDSRFDDRYAEWRPTSLPTPARLLLHGHVHTAWKRRGICINVGVDVWDYAPVSVDQLVAYCQDEGVL